MTTKSTDEKKKNPHQTIKRERTLLRHEYDDAELRRLAETLAHHVEQKAALEQEKKAIAADYKAKVDEESALITGLSSRISSGFEMTPTICIVLIDKQAGLKRYFPADSDPDKLEELEAIKDEPLPAGYQLDLEDRVIEAETTADPGLDVAVDEEKPEVPGDALKKVKEGTLEKGKPGPAAPAFKAEGDDGLLDFERWAEVTEQTLDPEDEPDSKGKGFQLWLIWLQYLINYANNIIGKSREMTPPVEFLKEMNKPALNRCRNWALQYIRTKGVTDHEGHKLPGPPDFLPTYGLELMKPRSDRHREGKPVEDPDLPTTPQEVNQVERGLS